MKLYFKPVGLLAEKAPDNQYILSIGGKVLGTYRSARAVIKAFHEIRKRLESELPPHELSSAERSALLDRYVGDSLLQHNSFYEPEKKSASRKTRTFG